MYVCMYVRMYIYIYIYMYTIKSRVRVGEMEVVTELCASQPHRAIRKCHVALLGLKAHGKWYCLFSQVWLSHSGFTGEHSYPIWRPYSWCA